MALFFESAGLFGTDFVEGLAKVLHDVKAVENMYGGGEPLADNVEVGFPDIRADDGNLARKLVGSLAPAASCLRRCSCSSSVKPSFKVFFVRFSPIHNRRRRWVSIWYSNVR